MNTAPAWGPGHSYDPRMCHEDVHVWFDLTYASYLVWPRTLMSQMPAEWQHRFQQLAEEMEAAFKAPIVPGHHYEVRTRDDTGRFVLDPLRDYRHPGERVIEDARVANEAQP